MATNLGTYLTNQILDWLGGGAFPSAPTDVYVALFDGDPLSGGTEVTTTVRVAGRVAVSLEAVANGTDTSISSDADADFGNAAGAADVTHIALYDAASSGNQLLSKSLGGTISIAAGQQALIKSGDLTISGTPTSA